MDVVLLFPTDVEMDAILGGFKRFPSYVVGMGKVASCSGSFMVLSHLKPDIAILLGFGGAYEGSGLGIGDVVACKGEFLVDECVRTKEGISPICGAFPVYGNFMVKGLPCDSGYFNTVSSVSGDGYTASLYYSATGAVCENMEGASVAHVCYTLGIPLIEVRAISNMAGSRRPFHVREPAKNLRCVLEELCRGIENGDIHLSQ